MLKLARKFGITSLCLKLRTFSPQRHHQSYDTQSIVYQIDI
jgi:hypothetical protein